MWGNMETKKGITGSTLKIIAIIAMMCDHIAWTLVDTRLEVLGVDTSDYLSPLSQIGVSPVLCILSPLLHMIGRITFPIMLFALVEGATYTKNWGRYFRRMIIFALVSEIPYNLAFDRKIIMTGGFFGLEGQNAIVTLLFCLLVIWLIKKIIESENIPGWLRCLSFLGPVVFCSFTGYFYLKRFSRYIDGLSVDFRFGIALGGIMLMAYIFLGRKWDRDRLHRINLCMAVTGICAMFTLILDCDYRYGAVLAVAIMYIMKADKNREYLAGTAMLTSYHYYEVFALLAYPVIRQYNGKPGRKLKYLFYAFYPGHLLALWGLRLLLNL